MKLQYLCATFAASTAFLSSSLAFAQAEGPVLTEPSPSAADASCSWRPRACAYPHLVLGLDAGISHWAEGNPFGFGSGTGSVTSTGPAWGLRVGVELTRWFAIEAHYIGIYNSANASVSQGETRGLLTSAGTGELRFTAPTPIVQPYLFLGAGIYSTSVSGAAATTELFGSTEFGMPVGVGFSVSLPRGLSVGAEATYHRLFGESLSDNEEIGGGDPFTLNAVLRARL